LQSVQNKKAHKKKENMTAKSKKSGNSTKRKPTSALKSRKGNLLKNFPAPVRKDKIKLAKKRVANGFYTSSQINALIAERIIQDFRDFRNTSY